MPYTIKNKPVANEIRRIVDEQIGRALEDIEGSSVDQHEALHEVRKRCKRIRAILRMVRDDLGKQYGEENAWYRDLARPLSPLRDGEALVGAVDKLVESLGDSTDRQNLAAVRAALVERRGELEERIDLGASLEEAARKLRDGRQRLDHWRLSSGFDMLAPNIERVYRRGRNAMRDAYAKPSTRRFHDWRKRVKYHRHQLDVLSKLWKPMMETRQAAADELGNLLGDEHDLAVLRELIGDEPERFKRVDVPKLIEQVDARRQELLAAAQPLGERLYAEKPKQFLATLEHYWRTWRRSPKKRKSSDHEDTKDRSGPDSTLKVIA